MQKNVDWATESEIRIAVIDLELAPIELHTPLFIPLKDTLKGIIFGDAHAAPHVVADGVRSAMGPDAPEMFRCLWTGAVPTVHPF